MAQLLKNPPTMQRIRTWVQTLGWKDPLERNGYPLQYSGLENSIDYIVHGIAKSQAQLSDFHFHFKVSVSRQLDKEEGCMNTSGILLCHRKVMKVCHL